MRNKFLLQNITHKNFKYKFYVFRSCIASVPVLNILVDVFCSVIYDAKPLLKAFVSLNDPVQLN